MKKFFLSLIGSKQASVDLKNQQDDERLNRVNESYAAFLNAAGDTLTLAQDVTTSLRDKIDDYTSQIEATSLVIPDALILVGSDGRIENINAAAERIFGHTRIEVFKKNLADLFVDPNGRVTIKKLKSIYSNKSNSFERLMNDTLTIRGIRKNGTLFYPNIQISEFEKSDGTKKIMLLVQDITDSVMAEKRFIDIFAQQSSMIQALPDVLIMVDRHLTIKQVFNSSVQDSFIYDYHINQNLADILSEENLETFKHYCSGISQNNQLEAWNFSIENNNGSRTYFDARASLCGDDVLIVMRDETNVVITREKLLESEEHFRVFGQASNEAMMIHDHNRILDWNPRLAEMTGYSNGEIARMSPSEFIHPMERLRTQSNSDTPCRAYTTLFYTKSGQTIEVAINTRDVEWKNSKARIKVIRDITHLKDIENLLHLSRERYKTITDNTFDVVASYGLDLKLTFVNQTFLDYFGKKLKQDSTLLDHIDPRDHARVETHLSQISQINPVKRTLHRVSYNGETRWLDWIDRAVFDDNGNFLEFQGIGRDVTDYIKKAKEITR